MKKEEKNDDEEKGIVGRGAAAEKEEFFGFKLKSGISVSRDRRRDHYCTTPVTTWKIFNIHQHNNPKLNYLPITYLPPPPSTISARKLGAQIWENIHIILPLSTEMHKGSSSGAKLRQQLTKKVSNDHLPPIHLADPSPEQLESAGSLRRHIEASLMKHHHSIERNSHALQPVSPASYSSSTEVIPSSLNIRRRHGEATYNLKTSTELLQVLNRIWSLEEQHTSNISLIKALKIELNNARSRIKDLLQEQQTDRQEIDEFMKQVAVENHTRKSKEQARIKAAVQSVKDELEDERQLRRRSETLHRKLSRELSEVKYTFAKTLKEFERESKARMLLEALCDEFAKGIGEYEHEVRAMNHKSERDNCCRDDHDRLILHISETWLDERMQMNLAESRVNPTEKNTVVEKLSTEIETFLQAKRSGSSNSKSSDMLHPKDLQNDVSLRRQSLESVHLNDAVTAPQAAHDKEESHCVSHFTEPNKDESEKGTNKANGKEMVETHPEEIARANSTKKRLGSRERTKGRTLSSVQFGEQMASVREEQEIVREQESNIPHELENFLTLKEGTHERKVKRDGTHGSKSKNMNNNLVTSQSMLLDCEKLYPEKNYKEDLLGHSAWRRHASPVQQWRSNFTSPDIEISESSSKWPPPRGMQETTLKAKLLGARQEGRHSRGRASKATS